MSNITQLLVAGADAFTNLFDVKFVFPKNVLETMDAPTQNMISVRIQDFPFPTPTITPYNVSYKAVTLKRFAPKIEMERKITIPIRLDSDWSIYTYLKKWKALYFDDNFTTVKFDNFATDSTNDTVYGQIEVKGYSSVSNAQYNLNDTGTTSSKIWTFKNVACINVIEPQFTRDSATPITISAEFLFGVYIPAGETPPA